MGEFNGENEAERRKSRPDLDEDWGRRGGMVAIMEVVGMWPKLYGPDFFISRGAPLRDVPLVCLCQKGKCETTNTGGALSHSAPLRCKNSRGAPGRDVPPLCGVKIDTRDHQNPLRTRR